MTETTGRLAALLRAGLARPARRGPGDLPPRLRLESTQPPLSEALATARADQR